MNRIVPASRVDRIVTRTRGQGIVAIGPSDALTLIAGNRQNKPGITNQVEVEFSIVDLDCRIARAITVGIDLYACDPVFSKRAHLTSRTTKGIIANEHEI